jgi:transcriptional regulator with XRE-family HTH domain
MHVMTVAARLAGLRRSAGLSMQAAAGAAGLNTSTIYRIEHGLVAPRESTARLLLALYGQRAHQHWVVSLLRGEREPGWFDAPEVPLRLGPFLAMEDTAEIVYAYHPRCVPPLLQTPAYAEAAARSASGHDGHDGQDGDPVALVTRRQEILDRPRAPHLWAVLDRVALADPPLAVAADRREQLDAVVSASKRPNVAVQITRPAADTGLLYQGPPFTLLRFPEPDRPDALVLHLLHGPVLAGGRECAEDHQKAFARLSLSAFGVDDTFEVLDTVRRALPG